MLFKRLVTKRACAAVSVAIASSMLIFGSASAGSYEYYPGSVLHLGGNFNPEDLTLAYPSCITYKREFEVHQINRDIGGVPKSQSSSTTQPPTKPTENVAAENELSIQQLKTRESLYNFLDVSIAASGHYGFFSASASLHSQNEDTFDSDSFVFGVRGTSTFAELGLIDPQLTTEAEALLKDPIAFHQRCGREWISQETRGVLIAVVYTIKNVSKSQKSLLEAAISGGYNSPGLGIDISGKMTSILQTAFSSNAYSATIHIIGGKGVSDFSSTITKMDDPVSVLNSISEYMKTLTYANSVPLRFSSASLDQFITTRGAGGLFDSYNRRIGDLYLTYQDYKDERNRLWRFLHQDVQSGWGEAVDGRVWDRLKSIDAKVALIEARAQTCRRVAQIAERFVDAPATTIGPKSVRVPDDQKLDFVHEFSTGISPALAGVSSVDYATSVEKLTALKGPPGSCSAGESRGSEIGAARGALCSCLDDAGLYLESRLPISAVPHVTVIHDQTLKPRSILYVSVVSDLKLTSVQLIDHQGTTVADLEGGFDPEQGPIWYGAVLFKDGSGNPPSADKLPYVIRMVDYLGRTFARPVVPVD